MSIGTPSEYQKRCWPGVETFIYCYGCNSEPNNQQAHECNEWSMCSICGCTGWIDGAWCLCQPGEEDYNESMAAGFGGDG